MLKLNKKIRGLVILAVFISLLSLTLVSAKTDTTTTTDTYRSVDDFGGLVVTTFNHENVHLTQLSDGTYIFVVHEVSSMSFKLAPGEKYVDRINDKTVTITTAGNGGVINGFYTERFDSFGYVALFHSEYTYSNGEIRVNHYWTKEG